jgi:hypothetical protein
MPSIALITIWSGPLPRYLPIFLASAGINADVAFFFIADQPAPDRLPPNVIWVERSWSDTLGTLGRSVGLDLPKSPPYKSCDYKPSFGLAFSDILRGYDFWGHADCDMALGRVRDFATDDVLSAHDIVTFRGKGFVHGPLTIYRNSEEVNRLFQRAEGWEDVFHAPTCQNFTETGGCWDWWTTSTSTYSDVKPPDKSRPSMTEAVRSAQVKNTVRWYDINACEEFSTKYHFHIQWIRGRLYHVHNKKELAFYHFIFAKADPAFRMPDVDPLNPPESFEITRKGVRESSEGNSRALDAAWAIRRAIHFVESPLKRAWGGASRRLELSNRAAAPAAPGRFGA